MGRWDEVKPDPWEAAEDEVLCVCEHPFEDHPLRKVFLGKASHPCRACRCREFEPDAVWRDSHGQPVDYRDIADGSPLEVIMDRLDMPEDHARQVQGHRDVMSSFYYTDLGVLVIVGDDGEELVRMV